MKLGYSEFSFGYAFTENLIRGSAERPTGAPRFPNLIEEGRLGFDVKISLPACPLFFQYKLPDLMTRNSAMEVSQFALRGLFAPFFRMPLMQPNISDQHELLIEWEEKFPNSVFYATPEMQGRGPFNTAYNAAQVHLQSALFSPMEIGTLPDDFPHSVSYRAGFDFGWFCSEPKKVSVYHFEDIDKWIRELFVEPRYSSLSDAAENICKDIRSLVSIQLRDNENAIRRRIRARRTIIADLPPIDEKTREATENILVAREFARIGLGVEMIIAQPKE